ncbi:MAG: NepR family anti-sigma factor [Xanthobacteraceae bacterium]
MQSALHQRKATAKLGRDVQSKIGQQLRAMYDDVLSQGVPDRFVELLDRLDKRDNKD